MRPGGAFDVAIIGAGPAGASLAIALSRAGYDTILLHRPDRRATQLDATRETLTGIARMALQTLGIWDAFCQTDPLPSTGALARWGDRDGAEMPAMFASFGSGWHVNRTDFDAFLRARAKQAGAKLRLFDGLGGAFRMNQSSWHLQLRGTEDISAAFVVDASGRSRILARRLGAKSVRDDDLIALIDSFHEGGQALSGKLLIEATKHGWCYAIPASEGSCTVALMTDPATVSTRGLGDAERWHAELFHTSLISRKMDLSTASCKVHRRLAGASRAMPSGGGDWLAVGDAAMSFDPLSGRGLTQAIWDGLRAAEAISHWLNGARTPLHRHLEMQTAAYDRHILQKQSYYRLVERWPDIPFWQHRSGRKMADHDATFS